MSNAPLVAAATGSQQARAAANNPRGVSALLYACQQGDVDKVRRILRAQPNAHLERDRTGKSALHYCCTSDRISAAQAADVLVMAAPDLVESRDEDGFTPLHLAVIAGNMPLVTFLLANNADVNAVDNEKHTVVHWATVCGETVALRAILAAGAPVSTPDVHGGYPLHYAAQMCGGEKDSTLGLQVLHTLLSHQDISVLVEDGDGRPPLLWAASAGSAKAVLALIRAGSAVEAHDKDGLTALHCAASRGHTDCIDTLLTLCGASPDVIDSNGCTALHYAVTLGHADATALLLAHAADPNRQDRKGRSPAHCGCAKGQIETVKMLGGHGANLWLRNARGDLPLHEAAASGRRDLVKWLLEARPSQVNARNNDGRCPLHLAALNDNADMCKILLDTGAQINPVLRTSKNLFMTPLDCALQRGFRSTAKFLQLHGGVPANRLGGTPQGAAAGSAVSLHIRDDVTLWGDTSSETEKEEVSKSKTKKKSYKRKLSYKYEKKKAPISASEFESEKISSDKLQSEETLKAKNVGKNEGPSTERREGIHDFPFLSGNNIPPGEIFIYANEVNINDKFGGLRIQQNGEMLVSDPAKIPVGVEQSSLIPQQTTKSVKSSANSVGDKRPKSAKYGRVKSKSSGPSEKADSTKRKTRGDVGDPHKRQTDEEASSYEATNDKLSLEEQDKGKDIKTGEDATKVKKKPEQLTPEAKSKSPKQKTEKQKDQAAKKEAANSKRSEKPRIVQSDQQSARSNTSYEDGEDHKELVVEAAIHTPPKEISESIESPKKALEVADIIQERRRTPIGSELPTEDDLEKIEAERGHSGTSAKESKVKVEHEVEKLEAGVVVPSLKDGAPTITEVPTAPITTAVVITEATTPPLGTVAATTEVASPLTGEALTATKAEPSGEEPKPSAKDAALSTGDAVPTTTEAATTVATEVIAPVAKASAALTETAGLVTETAASVVGTAASIAEKTVAITQAKTDQDGHALEQEKVSEDAANKEKVTTDALHEDKPESKAVGDGSALAAVGSSTTTDGASPAVAVAAAPPAPELQSGKGEHPVETTEAAAGASESVVQDSKKTAADQISATSTEGQQNVAAVHHVDTEQQEQPEQHKNLEGVAHPDVEVAVKPDHLPATISQPAQEDKQLENHGHQIAGTEGAKLPQAQTGTDVASAIKPKKEKRSKRVEESETSSEAVSPTRKPQRADGKNCEPEGKPSDVRKKQKHKSSHKKRRQTEESPDKAADSSRKAQGPEGARDKQAYISAKRARSPQDSSIDAKSSEESEEETSPSSSSPSSTLGVVAKEHRSFKVLGDNECAGEPELQREKHRRSFRKRSSSKKPRAKSEETKTVKISQHVHYKEHERLRRSKIPTPVNLKTPLSKSDKHLDRHDRKALSGVDARVPSLPNIHDSKDLNLKQPRSISNLSAPLASTYSDNDHETGSDGEEVSSATRKKRLRKRSKTRGAKSAGSDYESSNLIDSGFEPSPRSSRIPKWKNMTEKGVNMTSVTQTIQSNIRRYHLERKIFQHLLDLKRLQIRSGQHNEAMLVKRAIDVYHRSCAATVGAGRYISQDFSFKSFENFLYNSLRKIQRNGSEHLHGLPEPPRNPLFCTQSTHRCDHATHAYTGVPCAAYLPKMDHHTIPKIGFECKPSGFLPKITPKNTVTLELCHGQDKQVISLPAERLDQNKRYYVTFTVKGGDNVSATPNDENNAKVSSASHRHSKSD